MLIVVLLYLVLNIALIGSVGAEVLGSSPAPIATAAGILFTHSGEIVAFIGIIAMLSAMNAYIIATSRILHTLSARFSVPRIRDLSRQGTPVNALVIGCAASGLLLFVSNRFEALATISVITTLIPYIFFCIAAWILVTEPKTRLIAAAGALSTAPSWSCILSCRKTVFHRDGVDLHFYPHKERIFSIRPCRNSFPVFSIRLPHCSSSSTRSSPYRYLPQ